MKALQKISAVIALSVALCSSFAYTKNNVSEINIDVTVRNDGSAYIVQNWHGNFSEGTENYIPIKTNGISLSNLTVSDQNGEYENIGFWDVNASFEEKSEKCGFNETADGTELCFGISNYGENSYSIGYMVDNFIKSYTDYDGVNFMFINPDMSTFPTDGKINISLESGIKLNESNCGIWGFGYEGNIEFQNGVVRARTFKKLSNDNSMIVMLRLDKGIILPKKAVDTSFEELKNRAFEGSNYGYDIESEEEAGLLETIIGFIILFAIFALVIWLIVFLKKRKKAIKKFYEETEYFRDVPNGGKIELSHYLAQNFDVSKDESLIIGATLLSMINKGYLEPQIDKKIGFFGKESESVNLKLAEKPEKSSEISLYNLLSEACGDDGILQEKELEKFSYKNPEKINDFAKNIQKSGEAEFISLGGFSGGAGNCIKDLSDKGKAELSEIMGLKKYLEDFTLIAEREIQEVKIWKDYMVYATLFGISEKVLNQFKKVYPERLPELENYNRSVIIASTYYRSMYLSSQKAIQAKRTSGGGGLSSIGGGGGFSGGGSGGGSR